jgi:trimeric autotransporter adhesin
MASTYVNDLRLNEMATGDASGSWGTVTNTNLELIGEAFSYGTETIGDADSTLTIADGAADAARSFYLKITSSVDLTTTRIVTLAPNTVSKVWMIENATTGSQVITIKQGSGATINVPNGQVKMISTDGAGSGGAVLDLLVDVDLTGTTTLVNLDVSGTLGVTGVLTATSLDISGDIDVDGTTNLDVVDIDGAVDMASTLLVTGVLTTTAATVSNGGGQFNGAINVGVDDTGYDVKFFGATAGAYMLWDESADDLILGGAAGLSVNSAALVTGVLTTTAATVSNGGGQFNGAINVGVDDTGYDVKFFGATAGAYMLWDESADDLILGGAAGLSVNSTALVTGVLTTTAATVSNGGGQFNGAINVGVDDTGYDVKFFGATTGKSLLWDESADSLTVAGNLSVDGGTIKLDGNYPVGTGNVALGDTALDDGSLSGSYNTALGSGVLTLNTTGQGNTGSGYVALTANTTGSENTAHGRQALYSNTTGNYNTALGRSALEANTTASSNTAVGYQSLYANTTGRDNTAVGFSAGVTNTEGLENTAIGMNALRFNTTGNTNTAVGLQALHRNTTASDNTAVGRNAMEANTTGEYNNAFGSNALDANTTGVRNQAFGHSALGANTEGDYNIAVGHACLQDNITGEKNVAMGTDALANNTTASNNTAIGNSALYANTTGEQNVAIGASAGDALTIGSYNIAIGYSALGSEDSRGRAVAVGYNALANQNANADSYNTAVGFEAGKLVTTGTNNTIVGGLAGDAMTTGSDNTIMGYEAVGTGVLTGANNTAIGRSSGLNLTSGGNNLLLGHDAGISGSPGGNVTSQSNIIFLGDANIVTANIQVDWTVASDARDKTDFTALDLGLDFVKALAPVTYKWDKRSRYGDKTAEGYDLNAQTPDGTHKEDWLDIGFKAQEVEALEISAGYNKNNKTNLVSSHTSDGKQMGLQYSKFVPILVKAIQELSAKNDALEARLAALES